MPSKDEMKLARMFKKELLVEEKRMTKIYSERYKEKQSPKSKEKHRERSKQWKADNKDKIRAYNKKYVANQKKNETPEQRVIRLQKGTEWRNKNRQRILARQRELRAAMTPKEREDLYERQKLSAIKSHGKRLAAQRAYREKHREAIRAYKKQWRLDNPDKVQAYSDKSNAKQKAKLIKEKEDG